MRFDMETNATDMARLQHWRKARLRTTLRESNKFNAKLLKKKALEYSNLRCHSLADLARMGHPYAERDPAPPHWPYLIHVQSGEFRSKWFSRTKVRGDDYLLEFGNSSYKADWLEHGTTKMIPRPIMRTIIREMEDELKLNNRRAYRSALGLHGAAARSRVRKYLSGLQ